MVLDEAADIVCRYTYEPFGQTIYGESDDDPDLDNPFKFTGQFYDGELNQYYLRARQYDPTTARFTSRDPILGKFDEPLMLHAYLYCLNDPVNKIDPSGRALIDVIIANSTSAWMRMKDAAKNSTIKKLAEEIIIANASLYNAAVQGVMNWLYGPSDVSDGTRFLIGYFGGFIEMQVGLRTKVSLFGTLSGEIFKSTLNSAYSKKENFLSWKNALNLGVAAVVGVLGDIAAPGEAIDDLYIGVIGANAAIQSGMWTGGITLPDE